MRTRILTCLLLPVLILACDDEQTRTRGDGQTGPFIGSTGVSTDALRTAIARISVCYRSNLGEYYEAVLELSHTQGARARQFASQVSCVNEAPNCDAAVECIGIRFNDCEENTFECDGNVATSCSDEGGRITEEREDCTLNPDGNTRCEPSLIECVGPDACETSGCDGDVAIDCFDNVAYLTDCAQSGQTCEEVDGNPQCVPRERVGCDAPCDGDIAIDCVDGVVRRTYDCSMLGYTCNDGTGGRGPCAPVDVECEHRASRCDGDVAEICILGGWFAFDCAQAGGRCAVNDGDAECQATP